MNFNYEYKDFPQSLALQDSWGLWKKAGGAKIPLCKTNDSSEWRDLETALSQQKEESEHSKDPIGLAFFLKDSPPQKDEIVTAFIDIDKIKTAEPAIRKIARSLLENVIGLKERSQSGEGFHILFRFKSEGVYKSKYHDNHLEFYTNRRFIATTGDFTKNTSELGKVYTEKDLAELGFFLEHKVEEKIELEEEVKSPEVSKVLELALRRDKFRRLHLEGDLTPYNGDHSSAVLAWHSLVSFYTDNKSDITTLFKQSSLCYGKWEQGKWERLIEEQHNKVRKPDEVKQANSALLEPIKAEDPYISLVRKIYQPQKIVKDVFTGKTVMSVKGFQDETRWIHLTDNSIELTLKAAINKMTKQEKGDLKSSHVLPALYHYESVNSEWGLKIEPEEWDGVDRVREMSDCLNCRDSRADKEFCYYFVKDWLIRCVQKVFKPKTQNRVLLFQGNQGIGKDAWLQTLIGGFEDYVGYPSFTNAKYLSEQDFARIIIGKAVCSIDEFDKISSSHNILKTVITKSKFDVDLKYERNTASFWNRCSYVASCNPRAILTDSTGNRRYIFLALKGGVGEAIKWDYPFSDASEASKYSKQILAQAFYLYNQFKDSEIPYEFEQEQKLKDILSDYAPVDIEEIVLEEWRKEIHAYCERQGTDFHFFKNKKDAQLLLSEVSEILEMKSDEIYQILINCGAAAPKTKKYIRSIKKSVRWIGLPEWFENEEYVKSFSSKRVDSWFPESSQFDLTSSYNN